MHLKLLAALLYLRLQQPKLFQLTLELHQLRLQLPMLLLLPLMLLKLHLMLLKLHLMLRTLLPLTLRLGTPRGHLQLPPLFGIEARRIPPKILALPVGETHRCSLAHLSLGCPVPARPRFSA